MAEKRQLTGKQAKFVQEYLVDMNATQAAIRAGYSPKSAHYMGFDTLRNPKIQEALTVARQELSAKTGVTPEKVVEGFARGAFFDLAALYDENGNLKNVHEIPEEARVALAGLDVEQLFEGKGESREHIGTVKKVKLCSRHQNLDSLAKHFGLYNADQSQKSKGIRFEIIYEEKKQIDDGDN